MSPDEKEMTGINANQMLPMLSTVKFPLALAALHEVEKGKLSMNQKLFIKKKNFWMIHGVPLKKNIRQEISQ